MEFIIGRYYRRKDKLVAECIHILKLGDIVIAALMDCEHDQGRRMYWVDHYGQAMMPVYDRNAAMADIDGLAQ